jgi:hypothetical protein
MATFRSEKERRLACLSHFHPGQILASIVFTQQLSHLFPRKAVMLLRIVLEGSPTVGKLALDAVVAQRSHTDPLEV